MELSGSMSLFSTSLRIFYKLKTSSIKITGKNFNDYKLKIFNNKFVLNKIYLKIKILNLNELEKRITFFAHI